MYYTVRMIGYMDPFYRHYAVVQGAISCTEGELPSELIRKVGCHPACYTGHSCHRGYDEAHADGIDWVRNAAVTG